MVLWVGWRLAKSNSSYFSYTNFIVLEVCVFLNGSKGDIESMRIVDSFVLLRKQRWYDILFNPIFNNQFYVSYIHIENAH